MPDPTPHIDRKQFDDAELKSRLLSALKGKGEKWTVADAVVASGLPKLDTERALKVLSREYEGHLDVGDSGEIVYRFPDGFKRRDGGPSALERFGAAAWTGLKWLFKVWIMFTLIAYVAIFIALIVAAVVALMAGNQNRNSSSSSRSGGGGAVVGLLNLIMRIFFWHAVLTPRSGRGHGFGGAKRSFQRANPQSKADRAKLGKEARPLYKKVFAYVFGDEDRIDPLEDDRWILDHIRYLGGRVTASDLALVTGWSLDRSDSEMTRLLADYDGDARVTDEGALIYEFKGLLPSANEGHGSKAPYIWERPDPVYKVSDNPKSTNFWITLGNSFNLVMSLVISFTTAFSIPEMPIDPAAFRFVLGTFPMIFSIIFFAIPLIRWIGVKRANDRRKGRLARRAWYTWAKATHEKIGDWKDAPAMQMAEHAADAARRADKDIDQGDVGAAGIAAAEALGGTRSDDVAGAFHFYRFVRELQGARQARLEAPKDERSVGAVVFSSETN